MARAFRIHPYRVALLPLALLAIVATTAIPLEWRAPVWWTGGYDLSDVADNLLLYAPLGAALWRRRPFTVFAAALPLSASIELAQVWQVGRYASPVDVAANVAGAVLGAALARRLAGAARLQPAQPLVSRRWLVCAALALTVMTANWMWPAQSAALSGWRADYALLLGNELTGDRPWSGTIRELALLPRLLSDDEARALHTGAVLPVRDAVYVLGEPLRLDGRGMQRLPAAAARTLAEAAPRANALTIVARVVPDNIEQDGPARIVSFSVDPLRRNFDLGQDGRRLVLRLQAPVSGPDATWVYATSEPALAAGREALIVASYDGGIARIELDGTLRARRSFAAAACAVPSLCDGALPAAWTFYGASAASIALALVPWRRRAPRFALSLTAGLLVLAASGALRNVAMPAWMPWLALLGALAVGLAARPASDS